MKLTKFNFPVSYEQSAITYVWKNDEDTLRKSPSLTTLNAYLIQNATTACPIKASWRGKLNIIFIITMDDHYYYYYSNQMLFVMSLFIVIHYK